MESYKFLFKPMFFIFNLLFATWLVLEIEKLRPSDFGKYESFFKSGPDRKQISRENKAFLKYLFAQYKAGKLDSTAFERQIEKVTGTDK